MTIKGIDFIAHLLVYIVLTNHPFHVLNVDMLKKCGQWV